MRSIKQHQKIRTFAYSSYERYIFAKYIAHFLSGKFVQQAFLSEKDIVICGIGRSGSTLVYNLVKSILIEKIRANKAYYGQEYEYIELLKKTEYNRIYKTHNFSVILKQRIDKKQTLGFFTHRNLLDIIASMIQKEWIKDIEAFVSKGILASYVYTAIFYAKTANINIIAYDDLMHNKLNVIHQIATALQIELSASFIQQLDNSTEVSKIKQKINSLQFEKYGDNLVDLTTGFHSNHINNPNNGKWKNVITDEMLEIIVSQDVFKLYNDFFGYEFDPTPN